ncbi:Peroxisomal targeting signal type 2 receptor [Ceraceosorus bombacis]|uniref:Peroxin-7 n=1 Tax=Ceraceosorus bombacis TaxID=401625 RepID=A0A0P1BCH1_9BASI|nr:Peroxisomal targeting signal type 2 receptor [Ceraceosorus bombacis]
MSNIPPGGGGSAAPPPLRPPPAASSLSAPLIARIPTQGFAGYNLAWSPFYPDKLALAGAANYGLVGNGRVHIFGTGAIGGAGRGGGAAGIRVEKGFDTQDGLYDVAWSEMHENQLVTGSGDGSIKLWDITLAEHPIRNWAEHTREVFSVDWNNLKKELFASSSWDGSVRVWHPEQPRSLLAIGSHSACVYGVAWSPHNPDLLASACGDGHLRLFDVRQGPNAPPAAAVPVGGEVLSLDWNKYRPTHIATGSTDRAIKVWDLRSAVNRSVPQPPASSAGAGPLGGEISAVLMGHEYAVRRVAWSPHNASTLGSTSYDMSARIWDADVGAAIQAGPRIGAQGALRRRHDAHTEFVVGMAWSLFQQGVVATCAWDCETHLWAAG